MKTVAIINQKGGVGKTTTTANLAYALTQLGKKVICIDYDSQSSLTNYLNVGISKSEQYLSITEIMTKVLRPNNIYDSDSFSDELAKCSLEELIGKTIRRPTYSVVKYKYDGEGQRQAYVEPEEFGFDLIPSHISLAEYELEVSNQDSRNRLAGFQLSQVTMILNRDYDYDYCLIDCPPSLGIMSINAIAAAIDGILIPSNLDIMSLRGVEALIEKIADIQTLLKNRSGIDHKGVLGILFNLYSMQRRVDKKVEVEAKAFFPIPVFTTKIPESTKAKEAVNAGKTYYQLYPQAAAAYNQLALEFIAAVEAKQFEVLRMQSTLKI